MSTQHPDNVTLPFFANNTELGGEDEVREAYYAFSHLDCCDEQMWDCEGKEVDNFIVKKLLTRYGSFFRENRLGQDVFLTLRVPNPQFEAAEAKILLETLESIPRSFDAAKLFYRDETPPIFEVILPMTTSAASLDRIFRYYREFVVGKKDRRCGSDDITISEWIGEFKPERINVIPLFEDMEHMLNAHAMTEQYLSDKDLAYQRVFLARSDPAMNYGLVSAVLLNKIALGRFHQLAKRVHIPVYPIIGVGSAPFRGNLKPSTVDRVMEEYPSVATFTIQSAFKYDHPLEEVRRAVHTLHEREIAEPQAVDEERCLDLIERYRRAYQEEVKRLAPVINRIARFVPSRRKRKLHIGLFGYSRKMDEVSLPRAITFTCALYSIGLPPELLGLSALTADDLRFLEAVYIHFTDDLRDALQYYYPASEYVTDDIDAGVKAVGLDYDQKNEYGAIIERILDRLAKNKSEEIGEYIVRAAHLRQFLG